MLKKVAQHVWGCARSRDMVARLGCDEFAIVQINSVQLVDSMILARQLLDAFVDPFNI